MPQKHFSKIWILIIILIFIGGGIFAWQYWGGLKKDEFFRVTSPKPNQTIYSPIQIKGEAALSERIGKEDPEEAVLIHIIDNNDHQLGWSKILTPGGKLEDSFIKEVIYTQPSSKKGIIKIFEYVPEEIKFDPKLDRWLGSYKPRILAEIPIVFSEGLLTIPDNWNTYNNLVAEITFRYPPDWAIREDYFYKDSVVPTVVACPQRDRIEGTAECIQINMPQFPCEMVARVKENYIGICTEDPEGVSIYEKVLSSFRANK